MALAARLVGWLLVLALFASIVSSQGKKIASGWEYLITLHAPIEPFAEFKQSVASLRSDLPSRGRIHLVVEPPKGDWAFLVSLLAENELAPLVLDQGSLPGRSIVLTLTGAQLDGLIRVNKWRVVRRAGPNVALVDVFQPEEAGPRRVEAEHASE